MVLRVGWGQDPECEGEGVRVSVGVRGRVHVVVTCGAWARRCGWGPCRRLGVGGEGKGGSRRSAGRVMSEFLPRHLTPATSKPTLLHLGVRRLGGAIEGQGRGWGVAPDDARVPRSRVMRPSHWHSQRARAHAMPPSPTTHRGSTLKVDARQLRGARIPYLLLRQTRSVRSAG